MPGSAATALREPPVAAARTPRASGPGPIAATFQRIGVVPRPPPSPADDGARAELPATPDMPEAIAEELRRLIAAGELDEVRAALAAVPAAHAEDVEIVSLRAALEVAETATHLPELGALATRFAADDGDHAARLDLAVALFQDRQVAEAVDLLVEGVRKDRDWRDQAMRRQLVTFFAALGHKHPATVEGRRKLAAVLFA
jgi:putative thioredoxin